METSLESESVEPLIDFLAFLVQKLRPKINKIINYQIFDLFVILLCLGHNFWTQNTSKSSIVSKESDFSLVSKKNLSEILPSSSLDLGPDEVGQKGLKQLNLWHHSQKKNNTKIFFWLQMWKLVESFEGFKSSLAQLSAETFLCKNICKLLDFSLNPPEAKVLNK